MPQIREEALLVIRASNENQILIVMVGESKAPVILLPFISRETTEHGQINQQLVKWEEKRIKNPTRENRKRHFSEWSNIFSCHWQPILHTN